MFWEAGDHRIARLYLAPVVEALQECVEASTACAATGPDVDAAVVAADLDCTDVAEVTRRVLTRRTGPDTTLTSAQLEACVFACERSHELCGRHAGHHVHCRICAEASAHYADLCRQALKSLHG